jgi:hypothetical protein
LDLPRQAGGVARENWSRFVAGTMRIDVLTRYEFLLTLLQLKAALTIDEVAQVNSLLTSADAPVAKQP